MGFVSIAIDGPVGSGKSSLSKTVAKELGYTHVDTGAIYRHVGLIAMRNGADTKDAKAVEAILPLVSMDEDVSAFIRTQEAGMAASNVSAHPCVRAFLLQRQRDLAAGRNVIMDGRDIGTVVLPDATVKLFLTAAPEDRARRRYEEHLQKGEQADFQEVLSALIKRDEQDSNRPIAPLRPAEDAIILDTTGNTFEQSVNLILTTIREKLCCIEC